MPSGTLKFSDPRGLTGFAAHDVSIGAGERAGTVGCAPTGAPGTVRDRRVKYRRENGLDDNPITASFRSA